jgi:hypothetical protein
MEDFEKKELAKHIEAHGSSSTPLAKEINCEKEHEDDASSSDSASISIEAAPVADDVPAAPEALKKVDSSSSRPAPVVVVSRIRRRGLFGTLTLIPEVTAPRDYPNRTKWILTGIGMLLSILNEHGPLTPRNSRLSWRCGANGVCNHSSRSWRH